MGKLSKPDGKGLRDHRTDEEDLSDGAAIALQRCPHRDAVPENAGYEPAAGHPSERVFKMGSQEPI